MIVFALPQVLWLSIAAVAVAYVGWRAGEPRRWAVAALRILCTAAIVLALADPILPLYVTQSTTVHVVDLGPAVNDLAIAGVVTSFLPTEPVVAFSNQSELIVDRAELVNPDRRAGLRRRLNARFWNDDPDAGGSNLAAALQLASAQIPPLGRGDVRLHATGASNHGDAVAEAWRLAERGIAVSVEPLVVTAVLPVVRVREVRIPGRARAGQTVSADVTLDTAAAGKVTVCLTPSKGEPVQKSFAAESGVSHFTIDVPLPSSGLVSIRAAAWLSGGSGDTESDIEAAVLVRPPANLVLVAERPDAAVATTLADRVRLTTVTPSQLALQNLIDADAVILSDVPADQLSIGIQRALRTAVQRGTGLLLTGAARSFGPGGYDDSLLAPLLPVRMPQQAESIDPSTTLVLIIDTSGSMTGEKIDLAKEIARLAISHLTPKDKVGIVEFYGGKRWAVPVQSVGNVGVIVRALDRLTAGGSTALYPAVEEAAFALRNVRTRGKHLLILSDGEVENSPIGPLVRQMTEDGIIVSAAQVGAADPRDASNIMPDLARWGNGHYYTVPDAYGLPDIRFKEPQLSMVSPMVLTPSGVVAGDDELFRNAGPTEPPTVVNGYVRTEAKPTADVLLKTSQGDPLMVRWRYGAGFVAALPTQFGSTMTALLQKNPSFVRGFAGLMRQLDDARGEPLRFTTTVRPAGVEVNVVAAYPRSSKTTNALELTVRDANDATIRNISAEPVGPGHWNVLMAGMTRGAYQVTATDTAGNVAGGAFAIAPPNAVGIRTTDTALLNRLISFSDLAARQAAALPARVPTYIRLQKLFAAASVLLLVAMVAVRRWPERRSQR